MLLKNSSMTEWLLAFNTRVWLLSSVHQHVIPQNIGIIKWFVALATFVQFHSSVCQHVSLQNICIIEWFVALETHVRLLPSVNQHMPGKFIDTWKQLETLGARMFVGHIWDQTVHLLLVNWALDSQWPCQDIFWPLSLFKKCTIIFSPRWDFAG